MAIVENGKLVITWCIEDIISRAKELDITINKEEAKDVLLELARSHDCSIGITWEVIDTILFDITHR